MSSITKFLLKQYWAFILICFLGTGIGIFYGGIWNFLPFLFLLLFFYEWNIAPKKDKTWYFFDSLPIKLRLKFFLKVIFPFSFSFLIIFLLTIFKKNNDFEVIGGIADGLRISSIFTLSSILALSLSGFLSWVIFFYIICYLFSFITFYEVVIAVFALSVSFFYLSEKRVSKLKYVVLPIVTTFFVMSIATYNKLKIFELALNLPIHNLQINLAENLLENKAFLGSNYLIDWSQGGNDSFSMNSKVLIPSKYDDKLLEKIELIFFAEGECTKNCHQLADLVANFPKNWNQERLLSYLNSENAVQQIYALEVIEGSIDPIFPHIILRLTHSSNQEVSELAMNLISKWGERNIIQFSPNTVF
ncbi:hypothetical protein QEJ31_09555 [Pigmentibacter sp. JX0631]|uniref:hypothetical protein n=1 Tax=Pigmentibacter sp. JX0631 TaxID=2976982 RepID=UPI002469B483|nr:hypothetical protein [Pigmentibacter sp. JX0631]WGL58770.1 hypothetical protein QEJ31_09555 [Pigmentibacter sp. JX0631]